ncbi:MAG: hypothetical protein K2O39_06160 [Clostridiales bacterium]|nr:hypothetical protein [Clostridiales bacterium]
MSNVSERIAKMIENDGNGEIKRTMRVAQSDLMALLSEYMDVTKLDVTVDKTDDGYAVNVAATASRIYNVGHTSDTE